MGRRGRVAAGVGAGVCLVVAVGLVVWGMPGTRRGDVDPVAAAIAIVGVGLAGWSVALTWAGIRAQVVDTGALAGELADLVVRVETEARARMLGGDRPLEVVFVRRSGVRFDAAGGGADGRLRDVADYYRQLRPGRLVVTGAAGAGKSLMAAELVLALLETRGPDEPVPVRMSLPSWRNLRAGAPPEALRRWIRDHLVDTYRLLPAHAEALVVAGRVLPVLDGLDEMDAADAAPGSAAYPRARQALAVLNAYRRGRGPAPLVVTCRTGAYAALGRVAHAAHVELQPVAPEDARRFVEGRVEVPDRWRRVLAELRSTPHGVLARVLSTPWRLTMAVIAYEQRDDLSGAFVRDPDDLLASALGNEAVLSDHLMDLFVAVSIANGPRAHGSDRPRFAPRKVHGCLGSLARYLDANATGRTVAGRTLSATDLVPHELWPLHGRWTVPVLAAICVGFPAAYTGYLMLDHQPLTRRLFVSGMTALVLGAVVVTMVLIRPWPRGARLEPGMLRTRQGLRNAWLGFVGGASLGFAPGFTLGYLYGRDAGYAIEFALTGGGAAGLMLGLGVALAAGMRGDGHARISGPRDIVRRDAVAGVVSTVVVSAAVVMAVALGLSVTIYPLVEGYDLGKPLPDSLWRESESLPPDDRLEAIAAYQLTHTDHDYRAGLGHLADNAVWSLPIGILAGALLGPLFGQAAFRYAVFVIGPDRRGIAIPVRLGACLDWAVDAGLLRVAGTAYQFRHRELQDWFARQPAP